MDAQAIEKFLGANAKKSAPINIHFKDRPTVTGVFVTLGDYNELKSKNFWRLINIKNMDQWKATKDMGLSRLFNGAAFTRLSLVK